MRSILIFLIFCSSARAAIDFKTAFDKALDVNPDLKSQKEIVVQFKEKKNQAWALVMPAINFNYSYSRQAENPTATSFGTSIFPSERTDIRLTATQPVFRGLREYAGISQASYQHESQQLLQRKAILTLYANVATQYYLATSLEEEIKLYYEEIEVNQKRLDEIKSFRNTGRARESDQLAIESAIFALEAQVAATEAARVNARESLRVLAGIPTEESINDKRVIPEKILSLQSYLKKIQERPDILSAEKEYEASNQGVRLAWGAHLPSVDVTGNYYFQRGQAALSNVNWDISLLISMPIFAGGGIQSSYRGAVADRKNKEVIFEKAKSSAEQEIKNLHALVKNDWVQVKNLEKASELAERNAKVQQKDVKLGLVNNLDVLLSITTAKQTKRNYVRSINNLKTDFAKLEAATAEINLGAQEDE